MNSYQVLINLETFDRATAYLKRLKTGSNPGQYLQDRSQHLDLQTLTTLKFIELLIGTKRPQIFAEFDVFGDGADWNQAELSILGDISIATPVTIFDNGRHLQPDLHQPPFTATLIFTPGALLRNGHDLPPVDWEEVTIEGEINPQGYYRLYERRFLPAFLYVNQLAKQQGKMALVTIPGMGCGQFAGQFRGQLGSQLKQTIVTFLTTHSSKFTNIKVIYYDPYRECENERIEIDGISLLVRPLMKGNSTKPQLCQPQVYAEENDNFDDYQLFSFVAWDHVSWPGNDFYLGARSTDDGVKAAATNMMQVITGIEGEYHPQFHRYNPPSIYDNWRDVISKNKIQIQVVDRLIILPSEGD